RDTAMKAFPGDVFHRDVFDSIGGSDFVDRHDVRVIESGCRLRLPDKSLARTPVRIGQHHDLDRDLPVERGILRQIHLSQAAGADLTLDVIAAEAGSWPEQVGRRRAFEIGYRLILRVADERLADLTGIVLRLLSLGIHAVPSGGRSSLALYSYPD